MNQFLKQVTWNRVAFLATIVLYCVLTLKGQQVPEALKSYLNIVLGGGLIAQGLSNSVLNKKDGDKSDGA